MNLFRHTLVYVLICLLALPPAAMAQGGITPDAAAALGQRPGVAAAANGVPLVNIAAPNASGLSHNQYSDFNVQKQGVILNNSLQDATSQLGGFVQGNGRLGVSGPAGTILNEVTSSNRSHIQGYIEVHGQKADVILANPNGITINGGGFINTGRATVTTGKPNIDSAGTLRSLDVRQGTVRIDGDGLNASNLTAFDIVARAAEINAKLYANDLHIVTGQNSYDPATGQVTPLSGEGAAKPALSIDSSALGGMYAGRISLTSSEKGVGVNLQGLTQSTNDLQITADGRLALREAEAGGSVTLASNSDLTITERAVAGKNLTASAKNIVIPKATAIAQENLHLQATDKLDANGAALTGVNTASLKANTLTLQGAALYHGEGKTDFLTHRAKGSGMEQGQFLDDQIAAKFVLDNLDKTKNGVVDIPIPENFPGRVIMPDGTFQVPTHVRMVPGGKGVESAFPVIPEHTPIRK